MMKTLNWLVSRTAAFCEAAHAPESAFGRCLTGPSYLVPLCILGIAFALLSLLQAPYSVQWSHYQMQAAGAPPELAAESLDRVWRSQQWAIAIVPILLLARWLVFAVMLWLTSQLFLANLEFPLMLTIVSYSYSPILVRDATIFFVLWMRGYEVLRHPDAMNVAIGLNLLFPSVRLPWSALLGNMNVFELWYLLLLTAGISTAAAVRWQKALALIFPSWLFTLLLQFGLLSLGLSLRASLGR
jgi:hypothetical protein